jgi:hypothetical protein
LCGYLEIVCQLGEDFSGKNSWAGDILKSADYEDRKLTRLRGKLAEMPPGESPGETNGEGQPGPARMFKRGKGLEDTARKAK